jgi:hypothetical protein
MVTPMQIKHANKLFLQKVKLSEVQRTNFNSHLDYEKNLEHLNNLVNTLNFFVNNHGEALDKLIKRVARLEKLLKKTIEVHP